MTELVLPVPASGVPSRVPSIQLADIGVLPLLITFPFMFYPKILEGDTQPWIFIGTVIALFTFRVRTFLVKSDLPLLLMSALCLGAFALRNSSGQEQLIRAAFTQVLFVSLFIVCRRERGDLFPSAIRMTILIWFIAGLTEYIFVQLGLPITWIEGRFLLGRGGVPSLASEPSTYGSLSMVQMMYLLAENKAKNRPYILLAAISVLLSGSLLALGLLVFPLMKLRLRQRIFVIIGILVLALIDYTFTPGDLTARLSGFIVGRSAVDFILDPSLNLRVGHIYFTLDRNLMDSLFFVSPVNFMAQYNDFAANSFLFIETGSDFILTSAGDLIYGSGLFGALLIFMFIRNAQKASSTRRGKFEKFAFIIACMLNPIPLSNVFLIIYAQRKT